MEMFIGSGNRRFIDRSDLKVEKGCGIETGYVADILFGQAGGCPVLKIPVGMQQWKITAEKYFFFSYYPDCDLINFWIIEKR